MPDSYYSEVNDHGTVVPIKDLAAMTWDANARTGVHNLLPFDIASIKSANTNLTWVGNTGSKNNVDFTLNDDGQVEVDASSSSLITLLIPIPSSLKGIPITINGCPSGGSSSTYEILVQAGNQPVLGRDYGNGVNVTIPNDNLNYNLGIVIRASQTFDDKIFSPMIRLVDDTNTDFKPYVMTNQQLTEQKVSISKVTTAIDLNDLMIDGIYKVSNTNTTNRPEDQANGFTLIVSSLTDSFIQQIAIVVTGTSEIIYTRRYGGNPLSWSGWYKITGTAV